jgi:hypothetical protein
MGMPPCCTSYSHHMHPALCLLPQSH